MAKIAILDDEPEVVTLLSRFLTVRSDAFMRRVGDTARVAAQVVAFQPDLILIPLYRPSHLIARPLTDFFQDVRGAGMLDMISRIPALHDVPLILFSFSVRLDELPPNLLGRCTAFLTFPEGLHELNPTISGFVGPAQGSLEDLHRLRADSFNPRPNPDDPDA
jgi:CheY-like chemotaxis protein